MNKRGHKHVKLLKISKRELEMIEDEWNRRYNLPPEISGLFIPRN